MFALYVCLKDNILLSIYTGKKKVSGYAFTFTLCCRSYRKEISSCYFCYSCCSSDSITTKNVLEGKSIPCLFIIQNLCGLILVYILVRHKIPLCCYFTLVYHTL